MAYEARIILDSLGPNGARLTTFELTYPRFVHAELMTHRLFSRNSASSRAIPTEKLIERIQNDPVMPVWWGKDQKGMQAREELSGDALEEARRLWLAMRDNALDGAESLDDVGLHKQIANRTLEPWMFITVLVTATHFDNFFALRVDPDAQPELREVADKALGLYLGNVPRKLHSGDWHLPLVTGYDETELELNYYAKGRELQDISVGRCARVSYLTHEGKRDPAADIELARGKMRSKGHMSPFEHVAQALNKDEWEKHALEASEDWISKGVPVGNLWGWRQYRKMLPNEHDYSLIKVGHAG